MSKILAQGAEAIIRLENNKIIKDRLPKLYRLKILDEKIRKLRTRSELKLLEKASKVVSVPKIISSSENKIEMEFINEGKLSSSLDNFTLKKQKQIINLIGKDISKLHSADIIHGDLTTSNMILVENFDKNIDKKNVNNKYKTKNTSSKNSVLTNNHKSASEANLVGVGGRGVGGWDKFSIFFIDFGLGFISNKLEAKAVDLHLLKQALEAKHFKNWQDLWREFEKGYSFTNEEKKVLERLKTVEKRGRYKEKY